LPRIFPGHQKLCTETLNIGSNAYKIIEFHCTNISYMKNYCNETSNRKSLSIYHRARQGYRYKILVDKLV
jgi:hypothetical protein